MSLPVLSIVVPVFNESQTIEALVQRIDTSLRSVNVPYEIIMIDDHSTDQSLAVMTQLAQKYPIQVLTKSSDIQRGKGYSLQFGFSKARGNLIAMIDADLSYPPEVLPAMLQKITTGADLVIAQRHSFRSSFNSFFFGRLHGLDVDVTSGLKLFRKEIIDRLNLHPQTWAFDLELVLKAKWAGYSIASVPIQFQTRTSRASSTNKTSQAMQVASNAIALKRKPIEVIPFSPEMETREGVGFHYNGDKYVPHTRLPAHETALYRLSHPQKRFLIGLTLILLICLFSFWHTTLIVFVAILTVLYFADLLFNLYLIYRGFSKPPELTVSPQELATADPDTWPTYTIFCPLYKEPEVIPQFVSAMSKLDYPQEKLQIMLLLEADDTETIAKANSMALPPYFEIIVVPHSLPKTKPKACNYGLQFAKGELCVIYDAEDVPDPDQLKKAALVFRKSPPTIACVQAKLNFYNPHQNILTRAFTAEYSLWFDLVLTGLQSINAPIPLGGTSNHFRTEQLRRLHGWDAFNVTEDCDLGIRLIKRGLRTGVLDSTTLEEANSDLPNWIAQRSRWIKGYMQTYLVHMRRPKEFFAGQSKLHVITFQLVVGGKILSMCINPLMWALTITYFAFRAIVGPAIESFYPTPVFYMAIFSLIFGNFLYTYYYMFGVSKRDHDELIKFVFLVPFYWLAMSWAAWTAFRELIVRPHHWAKTKHGLHLTNKKGLAQTQERIGENLSFA